MLNHQVWRFLVAGGVAAAANYGSRFIFDLWLPYEPSIVLAFVVGLIVGFALMRTYVFHAHGRSIAPQAFKYFLVNILALLQTLVVSIALARWILPGLGIERHVEALGHLAGVIVPTVTSYFAHRAATFR